MTEQDDLRYMEPWQRELIRLVESIAMSARVLAYTFAAAVFVACVLILMH
jgi:uncharacterized RDD family membrane protein YckC